MKLELVDEITVKTFDELEVHEKKVKDKIAELNPEYYYCGETEIRRLIWRTKIYIFKKAN